MRLNLVILIVSILAGAVLTIWWDHRESVPKTGTVTAPTTPSNLVTTTVPEFTTTDLSGTTHAISARYGKPFIIHFWATWCAPCVVEFPKLVKFAEKHPEIQIYAISSDVNDGNIAKFLKKQGKIPSNLIISRDVRQQITSKLFQTFQLPESLFVDHQGQIARKIPGDVDWVGSEIETYTQKLIGNSL